jgi:glycosyltransferase involved in cell wall biosynthesis
MLSILIPTYNYNAYPLAKALEQQALSAGIVFELICIDDGSFSHLNVENQKINELTNCKFIESKKNLGRTETRQVLANKAQYEWLLFLDVDVLPKHKIFLKSYLSEIPNGNNAIFGGFAYENSPPIKDKTLRYTFGKHREEIDASIRNKTPYKVIISANFMIEKQVFMKINSLENANVYGLDYLFGSLLKQKNVKVKHINNEVYHLGIETNSLYLEKARQAVNTLFFLYKNKKITSNQISLIKAFTWLNRFGLVSAFGHVTAKLNTRIENNLMGSSPNLLLFDLYRLGYFCRLDT